MKLMTFPLLESAMQLETVNVRLSMSFIMMPRACLHFEAIQEQTEDINIYKQYGPTAGINV